MSRSRRPEWEILRGLVQRLMARRPSRWSMLASVRATLRPVEPLDGRRRAPDAQANKRNHGHQHHRAVIQSREDGIGQREDDERGQDEDVDEADIRHGVGRVAHPCVH